MIIKRLFILGVVLISSISFVLAIYFMSIKKKQAKNSFVRALPSRKITPDNILDLKIGRWYLSGVNDDSIYLGNLYNPIKLLKMDLNMKDSSSYHLRLPEGTKLTRSYFNLVEDNSVYTLDGNQPILLSGDIHSAVLKPAAKPPYFTQAAHIKENLFVFRVVRNGENILARYRTDSAGFNYSENLLHKQLEGIFSTDGNLITEPKSGKVLYVYYYRNQFICLDSKLNLLYQGKTIDTNSIAKLKVATIKSKNQTVLAAPPIEVNKRVGVNENYLFIQSGLIADNEVPESVEKVSIIDVYAVNDGKYQFSFYLPDFRGFKVRDFKVYGQSLYALYDHYLYKYQLNF